MEFGENLIALRKYNGISRKELAEKLDIPYTTLRNYETAQREPGHKLLIKIAQIFSVSVDYLIGAGSFSNSTQPPTVSGGGHTGKDLSFSAIEVATAYETAMPKDKRAVRAILDLAPLEEDAEAFSASRMDAV